MAVASPSPAREQWRPIRSADDWPVAHQAYLASTAAARGLRVGPGERPSRSRLGIGGGLAGLAVLDQMIASEPLGATEGVGATNVPAVLRHELERPQQFDASLYSGHTGLLWTMAYSHRGSVEPVAEAASCIASGLLGSGHEAPLHFDLVLGGTGLLVLGRLLAARAGDSRLSRAVTAWLCSRADDSEAWRTPTGAYRTRPPAVAGEFYYDWGVAHGVPGVVATMAHSELDSGGVEAADDHLRRFARSVRLVELDEEFGPARQPLLPIFSGPGGLDPSLATSWCYGDAGAGAAIAIAMYRTQIPRWRDLAESYLDAADAALRRGAAKVAELEPGICHGAAGLALIAARLHRATGQDRFGNRAVDIVDRALHLGLLAPERVAGAHGLGLLCGVAGVGLTLHALLSSRTPDWDMILALS